MTDKHMLKKIPFLSLIFFIFSCGQDKSDLIKESQKYYEQGQLKLEAENYYGALKNLDKCIELDPENSNAYFSRAQAKEGVDDFEGMFADLNKCIELNPSKIEAYHIRGSKLYLKKEYKLAIEDMEKCVELDPEELDEYNQQFKEIIAASQEGLEEFDKALVSYNKLIRDNPDNASFYYDKRAGVKLELNDFEGAIQDYSFSIRINPNSEVYMNRATAFLLVGMNNEACNDFEMAGEMGDQRAFEIIDEYCN